MKGPQTESAIALHKQVTTALAGVDPEILRVALREADLVFIDGVGSADQALKCAVALGRGLEAMA